MPNCNPQIDPNSPPPSLHYLFLNISMCTSANACFLASLSFTNPERELDGKEVDGKEVDGKEVDGK